MCTSESRHRRPGDQRATTEGRSAAPAVRVSQMGVTGSVDQVHRGSRWRLGRSPRHHRDPGTAPGAGFRPSSEEGAVRLPRHARSDGAEVTTTSPQGQGGTHGEPVSGAAPDTAAFRDRGRRAGQSIALTPVSGLRSQVQISRAATDGRWPGNSDPLGRQFGAPAPSRVAGGRNGMTGKIPLHPVLHIR